MEMDLLVGGATIALAAGTFWLALETKRMAASTREMVLLEAQPHLALAELYVAFEHPPAIAPSFLTQIGLILANPGKVLVQYRVNTFSVVLNKLEPPDGAKYSTRGGVIHPGAQAKFFAPPIVLPTIPASSGIAEIEFDIAFWSVPNEEKRVNGAIEATIGFSPNSSFAWVYLNGPDYGLGPTVT